MSLLLIYEEYNSLNKRYLDFINNVIDQNLEEYSDSILEELREYKVKFEEILGKTTLEKETSENEDNLNDLKYLTLDSLFLAADLSNFYFYKEKERFKMRLVNYINKKRRSELGF